MPVRDLRLEGTLSNPPTSHLVQDPSAAYICSVMVTYGVYLFIVLQLVTFS